MEDSPVQLQPGLNGGLQNQFVDQLRENSETKKKWTHYEINQSATKDVNNFTM